MIGYFEANAVRARAWNELYAAAEKYRAACAKLEHEAVHGWDPQDGSELLFEEAYTTLERGIAWYRRLQTEGAE